MKKYLLAWVLWMCHAVAMADVTYHFSGSSPYMSVSPGSPYTTSMNVTGWFTTAAPLPANLPLTDIGPFGNNSLLSWSFSDGVNTYTPANSIPVGLSGYFAIATDGTGNISDYRIAIQSPSPVQVMHGVGLSLNWLVLVNDGPWLANAAMGAICTQVTAGVCSDAVSNPSTFTANAMSATMWPWSMGPSVASVPGLGGLGLLTTAVLLLGSGIVRRRRHG